MVEWFHFSGFELRGDVELNRLLKQLRPLGTWLMLPISVVLLLLVVLDMMSMPYEQREGLRIAAMVFLLVYHGRFCPRSAYLVSVFAFAATVVLSTLVKGYLVYVDDSVLFAVEIITIACTAIALPRQYKALDILKTCFWALLVVNVLNGISAFQTADPQSDTPYLFGSKFFMGYLQMLMLGFYISVLHFERHGHPLYNRVLLLIMFAASVACLLHVDAKTCLIGLAMLFLPALLTSRAKAQLFRRNALILFLVAANLLFFATVQFLLDAPFVQSVIQDVLGRSVSLTGRTPIYNALGDVVLGSPLVGWGYYNDAVSSVVGWGNAQNGILEILVNQGLLGVVAFVAMCALAVRRSSASACPGLVYYLFAIVVCSLVEISFNVLFVFALSLVYSLSNGGGSHSVDKASRGRHVQGSEKDGTLGELRSGSRVGSFWSCLLALLDDRSEPKKGIPTLPPEDERPYREPVFKMQWCVLSCGLSLLMLLAMLATLPSLGYFIGMSPSRLTVLVGVVAAAAITLCLFRQHQDEAKVGLLLALMVVLASCLICAQIYDVSYDGNAYHKEAVVALSGGWVPLQSGSAVWQDMHEVFGRYNEVLLYHYPKGSWNIAACLYSCTGDLEAAKAYTLIAMAASGMLLGGYLLLKGFKVWQAVVVSLIGAVNPITLAQCMTYYNDAFLMMALLALLVGLAMLVDKADSKWRALGFVVVACSFVLCAELKFTGFIYAGVFSLAFYLLVLAKTVRKRPGFERGYLVKVSIFFVLVVIAAFCVFGYSPYIINLVDYGHPFYPLCGEHAKDVLNASSPAGFAELSNVQKLLLSLFSQASNLVGADGQPPTLKVPFTFTDDELAALGSADLRISGFGVLYGGLFIVQIAAIAVCLPRQRRSNPLLFQMALCFLVPCVLLMVMVDESWWACRSPYIYFTSCLALVLLFRSGSSETLAHRRAALACSIGLSALLVLNAALFVPFNLTPAYAGTVEEKAVLVKMEKAVADGKRIVVESRGVPGAVYTLQDWGIPFEYSGTYNGDFAFDGIFNRLYYRIEG